MKLIIASFFNLLVYFMLSVRIFFLNLLSLEIGKESDLAVYELVFTFHKWNYQLQTAFCAQVMLVWC